MFPLAAILAAQGCRVGGSDRSYDQGQTPEKFAKIESLGIRLFPQDGSGITTETDVLVVSSAIEETIPDVQAARRHGIPIRKRAEILAMMFEGRRGIAIGGTSGKTTVTGMTGHILHVCGTDPVIVNGGVMLNFDAGFRTGTGGWIVAETDESDGSISMFTPDIAVLNNITLDHKPLPELRPLFYDFIIKAKAGAVINMDDPEAATLAQARSDALGFSVQDHPAARLLAQNIVFHTQGSSFGLLDRQTKQIEPCTLFVPGLHNISNALAALGAATLAGIKLKDVIGALRGFKGIKRRLEIVGEQGGITVIDDFAHNPDKIAATLSTLQQSPGRLLVMFQPHGFGPMKMMRRELAEAFAEELKNDDILLMPEIFYAGGTAVRDISSADLTGDVARAGKQAHFMPTREAVGDFIVSHAKAGDRVVIMGARDDTLSLFAQDILRRIKHISSPPPACGRGS